MDFTKRLPLDPLPEVKDEIFKVYGTQSSSRNVARRGRRNGSSSKWEGEPKNLANPYFNGFAHQLTPLRIEGYGRNNGTKIMLVRWQYYGKLAYPMEEDMLELYVPEMVHDYNNRTQAEQARDFALYDEDTADSN